MDNFAPLGSPAQVTSLSITPSLLQTIFGEVHETLLAHVSQDPLAQFWIDLLTDANLLAYTLKWFDNLDLSLIPIPPRAVLECKTMLGEAVDNVRDHAHLDLPETTPLAIGISCFQGSLWIQVWDQGPGFDIVSYLENREEWPDYHATRGRGLKILQELSDYLAYVPWEGQKNCLLIGKVYSPRT